MIPQENAKQLIVTLEAEKARIDQALVGLKALAGISVSTFIGARKRGRPSKAEIAARSTGAAPVAPTTTSVSPVVHRMVSKRKSAWTRAKRQAAAARMKNWWAQQKSGQAVQG